MSTTSPLHARRCLWLCLLALLACSRVQATQPHPDGYETLELRYEGYPGTVGIHELAEDLGYLAPLRLNYVGANASGGPHSIQAVVSGDLDIGSSFNGAIIKLIANKAPLKAVIASYGTDAVNFQGTYVLEDSPITKAADLIGKQVSMNTLGAHAEFALREWLSRSGLSPAEARQVSMIQLPAINGEQALRQKQVEAAVLGTIFQHKALARGGLRRIESDFDMFGPMTAGSIVMTPRFIEHNPHTVRKFVQAVARAFDWLHEHSNQEAIARYVDIIHKRKRNEDTTVVQHWTGNGVSSPHGRLQDRDFELWLDWLVRDGQLTPGQIKAADIYTNAYQA
ncbi:MAG: transport system substrate-binding protein, partial [Myxococcaceae bacterium]|nr:transport system substrate-binding protein [Myxococcaceae bacterium]